MRRFSITSAVVALIVISVPVLSADQDGSQAAFEITGIAAHETLQMREFANIKSSVVLEIPYDAVGLIGTGRSCTSDSGERWNELPFRGARGWVLSRFLAPAGSRQTASTSKNALTSPEIHLHITRIVKPTKLALRAEAGANSALLMEIPPEADLIATGRMRANGSDRWVEVRYAEKTGWVNDRFVQPTTHDAATSAATDAPKKTITDPSRDDIRNCNDGDGERKLSGCTALIKSKVLTGKFLAIAYSRRSDSEVELKRLEQAIDDRAEALKLQPGDKDYKRRLSLALQLRAMQLSARDGKAILTYYDKSIAIDPSNPAARFDRGSYYLRKDDFDKALTDLLAASRLEKANSHYRTTLAECYDHRATRLLLRNDLDGAIHDYGAAIATDPKNASFFIHRGFANALKKNLNIALLDYSQAITLQPSNLEAYVRRAELFERTHDPVNAISDLSVVLLSRGTFKRSSCRLSRTRKSSAGKMPLEIIGPYCKLMLRTRLPKKA